MNILIIKESFIAHAIGPETLFLYINLLANFFIFTLKFLTLEIWLVWFYIFILWLFTWRIGSIAILLWVILSKSYKCLKSFFVLFGVLVGYIFIQVLTFLSWFYFFKFYLLHYRIIKFKLEIFVRTLLCPKTSVEWIFLLGCKSGSIIFLLNNVSLHTTLWTREQWTISICFTKYSFDLLILKLLIYHSNKSIWLNWLVYLRIPADIIFLVNNWVPYTIIFCVWYILYNGSILNHRHW